MCIIDATAERSITIGSLWNKYQKTKSNHDYDVWYNVSKEYLRIFKHSFV